ANLLEKSVCQQRNVLLPFTQWRDPNFDDVQAIKKVLPELAFADQYTQIAVRRCNSPEICLDCLIAADSLKQTRIERTKQFHLNIAVDLTNFVDKKRPTSRFLDAADSSLHRSSKRSAFMPEKLALNELRRKSRTIEGDKTVLRPAAEVMNRVSNQLFARTTLAGDQHRSPAGSDLANGTVNSLHRQRLSN